MKQLTPTQITVVQALAMGATVTAAAKLAVVSRPTIYKWRMDPVFNQALVFAKQEHAISVHDRLQTLTTKALDKLEEVLDNPKSSPSVILKAALAILNRKNWSLPSEDAKDIHKEIRAAFDDMEADPELAAEADAYIQQLTDIFMNPKEPGIHASPNATWKNGAFTEDKAA